jgi:hypothetical protein
MSCAWQLEALAGLQEGACHPLAVLTLLAVAMVGLGLVVLQLARLRATLAALHLHSGRDSSDVALVVMAEESCRTGDRSSAHLQLRRRVDCIWLGRHHTRRPSKPAQPSATDRASQSVHDKLVERTRSLRSSALCCEQLSTP